MFKLAALCLTSVLIVNNSIAQEDVKQKFQRFGFKVGANYSSMSFNKAFPNETTSGKINSKVGFLAGFALHIPLNDKLSLQPEYVFSVRNSEVANSKTTYSLSYFSAPLLLRYEIAKRFAIVTGPQLDLLISANRKTKATSVDIIHDTEERGVGATAGFTFEIAKPFAIEGRYYHGFNHIGVDNHAAEFSYRVLSLSGVVSF